MRKRQRFLFILSFGFCAVGFWGIIGSRAYAAEVISSTELISHAARYDGKVILFSGEVIGEIMPRGNHVWVNINDGKNAIGVWMDKGLTKAIRYQGSYKTKGDLVKVEGIFNRACPEHGGDLDIHAARLLVISSGSEAWQRLEAREIEVASELAGILGLVWILYLFKRRQKLIS